MELKDFLRAKGKFVAEPRPGEKNEPLPQYYQWPFVFCAGNSLIWFFLPTKILFWIWKETTHPSPTNPQHQVKILKVKRNSCFPLVLQSSSAPVWFVPGLHRSCQQQNERYLLCEWFFTCLFPWQSLQPPLPPLQSCRTPALGADVRIRFWQHESFIKIPVSSLAGALRPYFSESNFTFRHKYILLVYHKLCPLLLLLDPQGLGPLPLSV